MPINFLRNWLIVAAVLSKTSIVVPVSDNLSVYVRDISCHLKTIGYIVMSISPISRIMGHI